MGGSDGFRSPWNAGAARMGAYGRVWVWKDVDRRRGRLSPIMHPKELHDLYAPLWDAVPETRPRDTEPGAPDWMLDYDDVTGMWWFTEAGTGRQIGEDVVPAAAHALCRVAAEDWLTTRGVELRQTVTGWDFWRIGPYQVKPFGMWGVTRTTVVAVGSGGGGSCSTPPMPELDRPKYRHHALVAACLAVAGSPPTPGAVLTHPTLHPVKP